jgi:hypothetical protein
MRRMLRARRRRGRQWKNRKMTWQGLVVSMLEVGFRTPAVSSFALQAVCFYRTCCPIHSTSPTIPNPWMIIPMDIPNTSWMIPSQVNWDLDVGDGDSIRTVTRVTLAPSGNWFAIASSPRSIKYTLLIVAKSQTISSTSYSYSARTLDIWNTPPPSPNDKTARFICSASLGQHPKAGSFRPCGGGVASRPREPSAAARPRSARRRCGRGPRGPR